MANDMSDRKVVLLIDDDPEALRMLIEALEDARLTALVARDGVAALQLLDRITPDLILLDVLMPGIRGFELCRLIKARGDMTLVPVVFMTGLSDAANVVEGLRAGGVDYVTKPINPEELIARISIHIANARLILDARSALDVAGQAVAALAPDGGVAWASPRAAALLEAHGPAAPGVPATEGARFRNWIAEALGRPVSLAPTFALGEGEGPELRFAAIGRSSRGHLLVRLSRADGEAVAVRLAKALGLSLREAEVLTWLSQGKTNRDIAAILGLSPRTVTKHVEQVFQKLGVENRTSAAAIGLRHLGD